LLAEKYGRGQVVATTRLSLEIPWVKEEDIESFKIEARELGLKTGGTGKRVRPIVACKGSYCVFGLCDTHKIGGELVKEFFPNETPSKFKIGIAGCPNNCSKAQLNDIGIMGQSVPEFNVDNCIGCNACVKVCKIKALQVVDKKIVHNKDLCVNCGLCINACKKQAIAEKERGLAVYIGGKFGRQFRMGQKQDKLSTADTITQDVKEILDYYKQTAHDGERFSTMLDRIENDK
ncbi:MAG: 4Fe-4S binding protein, partial [Niameybacter sp.]